MINISSIGKIALPLGLMTLSLHLHARGNEYPNVIFILADDYGWCDLSCMGSKYYETPNLERLAKHGVKFTNAYAACQVSSPSRASIMTGKYTPRHGVTDWIGEKSGKDWRRMKRHSKLLPADYSWSLPLDEYTLAESLQDNGYTTFIAGKWHLGDKGSWPGDYGFEINNGGVRYDDAYSSSLLPLRGGKGRQWEGGIRVPLLAQYPNCPSGITCDVPVIGMDFYPTILDFAGLSLQPEQHKDGVNLLPVVNAGKVPERALYWHYPHYANQGEEPSSVIRRGDRKLIYYYEELRCELFNLAMDVGESEPLNIQYPEKMKELKTLLDI